MKMIKLLCENCNLEFDRPLKEYTRQLNRGRTYFYCCQSCATIGTKTIHTVQERKCLWCKKEFSSTTHKNYIKCCSKICAHKYVQSKADPEKISRTLLRINEKKCPTCDKVYNGRNKYCSMECVNKNKRRNLSQYERYKRDCQFDFSLSDYPKEFDFGLVKEYGWYSAKNRGDNINGVSRDHIVSIRWGFDNGVDVKYIRHPANCQLLLQRKNVSKGKKKSISVDELIERIKIWDSKYLG